MPEWADRPIQVAVVDRFAVREIDFQHDKEKRCPKEQTPPITSGHQINDTRDYNASSDECEGEPYVTFCLVAYHRKGVLMV
jgi:hypothetical protein